MKCFIFQLFYHLQVILGLYDHVKHTLTFVHPEYKFCVQGTQISLRFSHIIQSNTYTYTIPIRPNGPWREGPVWFPKGSPCVFWCYATDIIGSVSLSKLFVYVRHYSKLHQLYMNGQTESVHKMTLDTSCI